jgi:hypothetical protein
MEIKVRNKYTGQGRTVNKGTAKSDADFSVYMLDTLCSYVASENRNIRKGQLMSLRNLMNMLDIDRYYASDPQKMERVNFINKGLEARLEYNLRDRYMILSHILGPGVDPSTYGEDTLNNDSLKWVDQTVSEALKDSFICGDIEKLLGILTEFKQTEYRDRGSIVARLEAAIVEMNNKFRRARVEQSNEVTFSLRDGIFEDTVREFHDQLLNPANKLLSGMQGLNEMLAGGFESGRTYMLFGLPGEGKSTSMLDIAYQIKKYNKKFKPKDPTKIPCVVILTMENSVRESFERLFNMAASTDDIINFSADEVINLLKTKGELYLSDDNPIDVIIRYVPGNSVDTSYLYTLAEDLEDEGYEVIALIQDYVKKINSVYYHNSNDVRIELGAVVNEFKTFAILKDIPVISASQLNRDATKHIDEGRKATKADLVRMLGRSNIGESMLMLENIDAAFMIAPEWAENGNMKYLGIQNIKTRYKNSGRTYIYHPYVPGNPIKLVEDYYAAEPAFKETLSASGGLKMAGMVGTVNGMVNKSGYIKNNIADMGEDIKLHRDDSNNIFSSSNMIQIDDIVEMDNDDIEVGHSDSLSIYNPYMKVPQVINPFIHLKAV